MLINLDNMQYGLVIGKDMTDALFILRRMQEDHCVKGKHLCMCFVDL